MCEMEVAKIEGCASRSFLYKVPLPTPEGPEIMIGRLSFGGWFAKRELLV